MATTDASAKTLSAEIADLKSELKTAKTDMELRQNERVAQHSCPAGLVMTGCCFVKFRAVKVSCHDQRPGPDTEVRADRQLEWRVKFVDLVSVEIAKILIFCSLFFVSLRGGGRGAGDGVGIWFRGALRLSGFHRPSLSGFCDGFLASRLLFCACGFEISRL